MENLFYECDIQEKFDLKGSERNRLVDPMNQQQGDIVLLDENFVQSKYYNRLVMMFDYHINIHYFQYRSVLVKAFIHINAQQSRFERCNK